MSSGTLPMSSGTLSVSPGTLSMSSGTLSMSSGTLSFELRSPGIVSSRAESPRTKSFCTEYLRKK
jgi:hypothetical protein